MASNDEERKQIETDSKLHHYKAEQAYKTLAADASNNNFIVICVDLQQVLYTPTLTPVSYTHLDVYKRQEIDQLLKMVHQGVKFKIQVTQVYMI